MITTLLFSVRLLFLSQDINIILRIATCKAVLVAHAWHRHATVRLRVRYGTDRCVIQKHRMTTPTLNLPPDLQRNTIANPYG